MADAPFCNVTVAKVPGKPGDAVKKSGQPNTQMIPANANLQQVIRIINNNFTQIINQFGRPFPTPGDPGRTTSVKTIDPKNPDWNEVTRTTKKVRVTNPEDESQFVDIEQIDSLVMKHRKTGEVWKWKR